MEGGMIIAESEEEALKSHIAIRCAKAAILLSSLNSPPNYGLNSTLNLQYQEREEMLKREVEDLKMKLVKESLLKKKVRLCSLMELLLQIMILLSFWTFTLMFLPKFL